MALLANICVGLAAFIYLVPLQILMHEANRKSADQTGSVWAAIFLLLPLGLLLAVALLGATARGGFDWLPIRRGPQYLVVLVAAVALTVVLFFSFAARIEHPNHLPWVSRPFHLWAVYVFPLVVMAFVVVAVNPSLQAGMPPWLARGPIAVVLALSLLAGAGLLGELMVRIQIRQEARAQRAMEDEKRRDRMVLERVQSLDAQRDLVELLGHSSRHEDPEIRSVTLAKVQAHPDLTPALAAVLRGHWPRQALIYLDACDVPDRQALAEPVRDAIGVLTKDAQDAVARTHTFHADQFDWIVRDMLAVADKYSDLGIDYVPAIREYRRALDTERTREVHFNARATLDRWLAARAPVEGAAR